ncbi:MAG: BRCT domain-containing protein [Synechocystis sp.]|nr:BRCT domain-containing protein [Synechocystis sp.]
MAPLELIYPIIGLVFALGGGVYAWQTRRSVTQAMADLQAQQQALGQSNVPSASPVAIAEHTSEAMVHIQGRLRHLEQDLQKSQTTLQATLAARDELSHNYQAQEQVVATLRSQLTQQQAAEGDRLNALKRQNQELLQENSNLSDRLRQSVNSLAEARPKLLQLETLEAKNQQLTAQLQRVNQDRHTEIAQQLADREKAWQQQHQALTDQVGQLEQQIQQLTTERNQAQRDLQAFQDQVKTLENVRQDLTQAQQTWQQEREQLNAKLSNLDATQKSLALANQELTVKLETTQAQGDRLKAEKKEQAAALQMAQADVAKLQQQLAELEEDQSQSLIASVAEPELAPEESIADSVEPESESEPEPQPAESPINANADLTEPEPEIEAEPAQGVDADVEVAQPEVESEPAPDALVDQPEPMETSPEVESQGEPDETETVESATEPETEPSVKDDVSASHPFTDKKVVILGTLNAMNRETAKTRLQDLGAHYTSAPSSKTDYVVVGKAPGAKLKKAQKLGVPQLSEAQFLELLGE